MSPQDAAAFETLTAQLRQDIQPGATLENIIFKELARASWRLELLARAEDAAPDDAAQAAIDRARTTALNILMKTTAELRRLQTKRRIAIEISPDNSEIPHHSVAGHKEILTAKDSPKPGGHPSAPGPVAVPAPSTDSSFCKTSETPAKPPIPRRSPCPCKSGDRYKNCCGKNAPPVLHHGARPKAA